MDGIPTVCQFLLYFQEHLKEQGEFYVIKNPINDTLFGERARRLNISEQNILILKYLFLNYKQQYLRRLNTRNYEILKVVHRFTRDYPKTEEGYERREGITSALCRLDFTDNIEYMEIIVRTICSDNSIPYDSNYYQVVAERVNLYMSAKCCEVQDLDLFSEGGTMREFLHKIIPIEELLLPVSERNPDWQSSAFRSLFGRNDNSFNLVGQFLGGLLGQLISEDTEQPEAQDKKDKEQAELSSYRALDFASHRSGVLLLNGEFKILNQEDVDLLRERLEARKKSSSDDYCSSCFDNPATETCGNGCAMLLCIFCSLKWKEKHNTCTNCRKEFK